MYRQRTHARPSHGPMIRIAVAALLLLGSHGATGSTETTATIDIQSSPAEATVPSAAILAAPSSSWPYQAKLTAPLSSADGQTTLVPAGRLGVVAAVRRDGRVRMDFGRLGAHTVAIEHTDIEQRAQRIASGAESKLQPNLTLALGTRLVDGRETDLAMFSGAASSDVRFFLCVFLDPYGGDLARAHAALAPALTETGLLSVLVQSAPEHDAITRARVYAEGWPETFLLESFAVPYREAFLEPEISGPHAMLMTPEGLVLAEGEPSAVMASEMISQMRLSRPE